MTDSNNIMPKQIKISEEDYEKLKAMGKGSFAEKVALLLKNDAGKTVITPATRTAKPSRKAPRIIRNTPRAKDLNTHRLLNGLVMYFFYKGEPTPVTLNKTKWLEYGNYGYRADIIRFVGEVCERQGWQHIHPELFENWDTRNSKFQKKIDRILSALVMKHLLRKRFEQLEGKAFYELDSAATGHGLQYPDETVAKLKALSMMPASNWVPQVLLQKMTLMTFRMYEDTNREYVKNRNVEYIAPADNTTIDLMYLEDRSRTHRQDS